VDDTPPSIEVLVGDPNVQVDRVTFYVSSETGITINVSDEGCNGGAGVYDSWYEIWWNGEKIDHGSVPGAVSFDEECVHTLMFVTYDLLGNCNLSNWYFFVDNSPPEVESSLVMNGTQYFDGNYTWVTSETEFSFNIMEAEDHGCRAL